MRSICLILSILFICSSANAAILVFSTNGTYITKPDIYTAATAADAAGKTETPHQK